jgi:hypothetical protein
MLTLVENVWAKAKEFLPKINKTYPTLFKGEKSHFNTLKLFQILTD